MSSPGVVLLLTATTMYWRPFSKYVIGDPV